MKKAITPYAPGFIAFFPLIILLSDCYSVFRITAVYLPLNQMIFMLGSADLALNFSRYLPQKSLPALAFSNPLRLNTAFHCVWLFRYGFI